MRRGTKTAGLWSTAGVWPPGAEQDQPTWSRTQNHTDPRGSQRKQEKVPGCRHRPNTKAVPETEVRNSRSAQVTERKTDAYTHRKQMCHIAAQEVKCSFEVYLASNYLGYIFLEVTLVLMCNHLSCSTDSISVIQSHNSLHLLSTHHALLPIPPNSPGCRERQIGIRC